MRSFSNISKINMINRNNVNDETYKKLPISLLLNKNENIKLPKEYEYLVNNNTIDNTIEVPLTRNNIVDIFPEFDIYNDFKTFDTTKAALLEYIRVLFSFDYGAFPFDPSYGYFFKKYIQLRDMVATNVLFNNEIANMASDLSYSFNRKIEIVNLKILKNDNAQTFTSFSVNLKLKIDNEVFSMVINT